MSTKHTVLTIIYLYIDLNCRSMAVMANAGGFDVVVYLSSDCLPACHRRLVVHSRDAHHET